MTNTRLNSVNSSKQPHVYFIIWREPLISNFRYLKKKIRVPEAGISLTKDQKYPCVFDLFLVHL